MAKLNTEELITVLEHYSKHDFDPTGAEIDNIIEVLRTQCTEVSGLKSAIQDNLDDAMLACDYYGIAPSKTATEAFQRLTAVSGSQT